MSAFTEVCILLDYENLTCWMHQGSSQGIWIRNYLFIYLSIDLFYKYLILAKAKHLKKSKYKFKRDQLEHVYIYELYHNVKKISSTYFTTWLTCKWIIIMICTESLPKESHSWITEYDIAQKDCSGKSVLQGYKYNYKDINI